MANDTRIVLGLDTSGFVPAAKQAEKALDGIGNAGQTSARQIAAATRGLPAQFTDIAVQLQGGANPFTVLLQQGGQIKDQFGGVGNALRGIAATITPATVGFGLLAAGIGSVVAGFVQGQNESSKLRDTLLLTGNAAGLTASRVDKMAGSIAAATLQSVGGSREIVTALAATGQTSAKVIESQAKVVGRLADLTGKAGAEIAATFANQLQAPAKFAAQQNELVNFLNVAQFKRIQQLEKEGRAGDAALMTNNLLSAALDKQRQVLSPLEDAWRGVRNMASSAWDAMLNIGREESTLAKLEGVRKKLAEREARGPLNDLTRANFEKGNQRLRDELLLLSEQAKQESTAAESASESAAKNRAGIAKLLNGPAAEPLGAIRKARDQYKADFLRSEKDAYEELRKLDEEQAKEDEQRTIKHSEFMQGLVDANQRGSAELISDERERGLALIELDRQLGERRIREAELTGKELADALTLNNEAAAISQIKLDNQITASLKSAADASSANLTESISSGILEGFRRGGSLAELFARELKAQFAKVVLQPIIKPAVEAGNASIAGLFQSIAGMLAGGDLGLNPGAADFATGDLIRGRRAGGGSVQPYSDYLVGERGPEVLRMGAQGGTVIPNHALGGPSFNVSNHIHIEARTDAGQVAQVVNAGVQQGMRATMEQLRIMGVVRA